MTTSSRSAQFFGARLPRVVLVAVLAIGLAAVVAPRPARAATRADVLQSAAAYAKQQGYHVGIAVLDTKTGNLRGAGYWHGIFASESLIKVFIATRLLHQGRMHGSTAARAWKMITQSDDAIASSFYGSVGGDGLINWMKSHYHVPDLGYPPSRAGWWGNTHLRPSGLVKLYAKLKRDRVVAPWLLNAMHHAREYGSDGQYQFFGIPSATKGFAVKQGWGNDYEIGSSADFNTTGFINHDRYAVAILARGPSYTYGSAISNLLTGVARRLLPNGGFPEARPMMRRMSVHAGRTAGGRRLTVYGSNFTHVTKVMFGTKLGRDVKVLSPNRLTVTAPQHRRQLINVRVYTSHGHTHSNPHSQFLFERPPGITSLSSHYGKLVGGEKLTILGHAFAPSTQVSFGGTPARSMTRVSRTKLTVVAPKHAAGTVKLAVGTAYGRVSRSYTYVPAPTIKSLSETSGHARDRVTITGTDFRKGTKVYFGKQEGVSMYRVDLTTVKVTVPAQPSGTPPGPVDVTVTTPYGSTVDKGGFTYQP